jgi:hypothetical protein
MFLNHYVSRDGSSLVLRCAYDLILGMTYDLALPNHDENREDRSSDAETRDNLERR